MKNSPEQPNGSWQEAISQARKHLRDGQTEAALNSYFDAAGKMVRAGDFARAAAIYKLILKEEPGNPLALTLLSALYHNQGLKAEVAELLKGADLGDTSLQQTLRQLIRNNFTSSPDKDYPWLPRLQEVFQLKEFAPGSILIKEGQKNQTLYLVLDGCFAVSFRAADPAAPQTVTKLGPGAICGEFSMLTGEPASATVTALSPARTASLKRSEVDLLANHFPELSAQLLASYRHRKQELIALKVSQLKTVQT